MAELRLLDPAMMAYWQRLAAEATARVDEPTEEERFSESVCPACHGFGFYTLSLPVGHPQFGKAQRCTNPDCPAAQENTRRAIRNYDLPEAYRELDFSTWQRRVQGGARQGKRIAFEAAVLFATSNPHQVSLAEALEKAGYQPEADSLKSSLAFYGPVGTGKTGLAAAIMNTLVRAGKQSLYRRTSDLFLDLQDAFNDNDTESSFAERLQKYQHANVLVLDEWRVAKQTDARLQWMEDIIRYRHGHRLPTVITTNLDPDSIYSHWTEQTADVSLEMAHWIEVGGEKLRRAIGGFSEG
jgi:DNA replication protein DnaC